MNSSRDNSSAQQNEDQSLSFFTAMSSNGRKLRRWEKAELISRDQILAILAYEKENYGKRFFRSLIGLALFAIGVGILSIVAANWVHIPGNVKIAAHFLLNIGAAVTIYKAANTGNTIWREGATLLLFALNMTLIVLIGQVFQLSGNYASALSTWMVISSPFVFLYGKTPLNAVPWAIAMLTTISFILFEFSQTFSNDFLVFIIFLSAGLFTPLIMIAAGASKRLRAERPDWGHTLFRLSMIIFALEGTIGSFFWYTHIGDEIHDVLTLAGSFAAGYGIMLLIIAGAISSVYFYEWSKEKAGHKVMDRTGIIFVVGSIVSATLPMILMAGEIEFVAALHFVIYWCFAGWIGNKMGFSQLITASVTLVTIRIIAIYIELFGSLLTTGFGLIFSGVLMLALLKASVTFKNKITAKS